MNRYVIILLVLLQGCGVKPIDAVKVENEIKDAHENDVLRDVISVDPGTPLKEQTQKGYIKLNSPLWEIKISNIRLFDEKFEYAEIKKKEKKWDYLESKFFKIMGLQYFYINEDFYKSIDFEDLFISSILMQKIKNVNDGNKIYLEGEAQFFNEKIFLHSDYSKERFWISLYKNDYSPKNKIFSKKLIQGENYFFDSANYKGDFYSVFLKTIFQNQIDLKSDTFQLLLSVENFHHENFSKKDIIQKLKKEFEILVIFNKELSVYLVNKGEDIFTVIKNIESDLYVDEYKNILSSNNLDKNEFLADFPQTGFRGNNLKSRGALYFSKSDNKKNATKVHYYFVGSYLDIFKRNIGGSIHSQKFEGSIFKQTIKAGELFKIKTMESNYKNIFKEELREIDLIEKNQRLECDRYEIKRNKYCVDATRRYKRNALFREFDERVKVKENEYHNDFILSVPNQDYQFELEPIWYMGEEFFLALSINDENQAYLKDINIYQKYPGQICREIKTGFIKLEVADDQVKPITPLKTDNNRYCEGNEYAHFLTRVK